MNYNTGDYIRFHTPEQWEQIVEKLERDGEKIYRKKWDADFRFIGKDRDSEFSRRAYLWEACQNDITDQFFDELEQEESCDEPDQSITLTIQITIN